MTENQVVEVQKGTPGWLAPAIGLLAIVGIAGVALGWYDASQLTNMQQSVASQMKTDQQNAAQQIATIEQRQTQVETANAGFSSDLGVVTKKLRVTQGELQKARKDASEEAAQIRDDAAQKLADLNTNVTSELATKASTDDLNSTNGNVTGVKTDLAGTQHDLKMARSEMGTLIARNHDEIDQLRRLGERDYVEFTIQGRNKAQKVGSMTVELRSVNPNKNQFTIALVADDLRTEKKNRSVNEPIFFFTHNSRLTNELVINSVGKDKIAGYISMPKASSSTTSASTSGN
jgi:vacuolar-type H+-ATPase subunit H